MRVTLDEKLLWREQRIDVANVTNSFWACRKAVEVEERGFKTAMVGWLYSAIIRPSLAFAALFWWPATAKDWAKKMLLRKIQRLACMAVSQSFCTTLPAALEIMLNLPPLDVLLQKLLLWDWKHRETGLHRIKVGVTAKYGTLNGGCLELGCWGRQDTTITLSL